MNCRVCGSSDLELYLELGEHQEFLVSNIPEKTKRHSMQVFFCHSCTASQGPGVKCENDIDYQLNLRVLENLKRYGIGPDGLVYGSKGLQEELGLLYNWELDTFVIYGMEYHDPSTIMELASSRIKETGKIFMVLPCLEYILEDNRLGWFNIHKFNYLTAKSLALLARKYNLAVTDYRYVCGSERLFVLEPGEISDFCLDGLIDRESDLHKIDRYKEFASTCYRNILEFARVLHQDTRVKVLSGVNHESHTIMEYLSNLKVEPRDIKYALDKTSDYWLDMWRGLHIYMPETIDTESNYLIVNFDNLKTNNISLRYYPETRIG